MHALMTWFSAAWSSAWAQLAFDVAVKATVLLLLAVLAALALRRSSAAVKHRVWCLAFAGLLLLPVLSAGLPQWRLAVLPTVVGTLRVPQLTTLDAVPAESGATGGQRLDFAQMDPTVRGSLSADRPPLLTPGGPLAERDDYYTPAFDAEMRDTPSAHEPHKIFGPGGLAALWLLGALIAASPLSVGLLRNYLLRRRAQPVAEAAWTGLLDELRARLGLRRRVSLYETRAALMPMTWGMLSPIVMLPHEARAWTERLRRFVLLHELAHVKRCDVGFQILARLTCALYWFHPLAWYALRRLRIERELACDDCVVQAGERPSDYATELLEIARNYRPLRLAAAVPMAQTSNLERRIRALFDRACSHLPISPRAARLLLLGTAVIVTTIAVIRLAPRAAAEADEPSNVAQPPSAETAAPDEQLTARGRVLDPDGKPFAGATIYALGHYWVPELRPLPLGESTSGDDGRFKISYLNPKFVRAAQCGQMSGDAHVIAAVVKGFGPGFVPIEKSPNEELTLRLVRDDVPVEGRVLDLEGRPVAGVRVSVQQVQSSKRDDLSPWIESIKLGEVNWVAARHLEAILPEYQPPGAEPIVTDATGHYRITGIGRERVARLLFQGPTIAYTEVDVVTRRMKPLQMLTRALDKRTRPVYGADLDLTASPTQPIVGTVRDADTGQPLPHVTVANSNWLPGVDGDRLVQSVSDDSGRYHLTGLPKTSGIELLAIPNDDQPFFMQEAKVPDSPALEPITVDFDLHRGIWITGRVTDKATGEPVPARVHYFPFLSNEFARKRTPEFSVTNYWVQGAGFGGNGRYVTRPDGSYRRVVLPGRAIVGIECVSRPYRYGVGAETIAGGPDLNRGGEFPTYRNNLAPTLQWPNGIKEIDPPADAEAVTCDFELDPGESVLAAVVDPDGKPLTAYKVDGDLPHYSPLEARRESSFEALSLGPTETRTIVILHEQRKLGKVVRLRLDDHPTRALTVKLEPCATVAGRLLDTDGDPVAGASLRFDVLPHGNFGKSLTPVSTDSKGQFRRTDVPSGCDYIVYAEGMAIGFRVVTQKLSVQPGETVDLGDVKLKDETSGGDIDADTDEEDGAASGSRQASSTAGSNSSNDTANADAARRPRRNKPGVATFRGHVLGAAGKPLAAARVRVMEVDTESNTWVVKGRLLAESKTQTDGRFSVDVGEVAPFASRDHFVKSATVVLADAPGQGFDWAYPQRGGGQLTLQLAEDATIEGRVLNLEGRPVAGVRVAVGEVSGGARDLDAWVEKAKHNPVSLDPNEMMRPIKDRNNNPGPPVARFPGNKTLHLDGSQLMPSAVTDREGRFRLAGLGRDRQVRLQLEGTGIAKTWLYVVTHDMPPVPYPSLDPRYRVQTCFGRRFDLTAEPEQPIAGVVRDAETGEPLPGVEVRLTRYSDSLLFVEGFITATTDDQGRYTVRGVPKPNHPERTHCLRLLPATGEPYFRIEANPPKQNGLGPVSFDVALRRATHVRGRVTDKATGDPVRGFVAYYPFLNNKTAVDFSNFNAGMHSMGNDDWYAIDRDGQYEIPALPGRGVVVFIAEQADRYPEADGAEDIADLYQEDRRQLNIYHLFGLQLATAVREANLSAGGVNAPVDIKVRPLPVARLELVDAQGRPVAGVVTKHLAPARVGRNYSIAWSYDSLPSSTIEIVGPRDTARTAMFLHRERRLAGVVQLSPDRDPPRQIVLRACATLAGRVVDRSGKPVPRLHFQVHAAPQIADAKRDELQDTLDRLQTDADGRFRLDNVPPGLAYALSSIRGAERLDVTTHVVEPGEAIDLGDVVLKAPEAAHDQKTGGQAKLETPSAAAVAKIEGADGATQR